MGKVYVIEHMEPDENSSSKPLPDWVILEYFHILQQVKIVGGKPSVLSTQKSSLGSPSLLSPSNSDVVQVNGSTEAPQKAMAIFSHLSAASSQSLVEEINKRAIQLTDTSYPIAQSLHNFSSADSPPLIDRAGCTCSRLSVLELMSTLGVDLQEVCLLDPKAEHQLQPEDGARFRWFLFGGILGDDPPRDRTAQLRICGFPSRHLGSIQMTTDTAVAVTKRVVEDHIRLEDLDWVDKPELIFSSKETVEMPFRYLADANQQPIMPDGMRELIRKDMDRAFEF